MGCASSSPAGDTDAGGAPPADVRAPGSAAARAAGAKPATAKAGGGGGGATKAKAKPVYDTPSTASYSAKPGAGRNAYFALLARDEDAVAVNLDVHHESRSRVVPAVAPADDSCVVGRAGEAGKGGGDAVEGATTDGGGGGGGKPSAAAPLLSLDGVAMTLRYVVLVGGATEADRPAVAALVNRVFERVNGSFNNWNKASEITRLCASPANKSVELSEDLVDLFDLVDEVHELSDGRFDPTLAPVASVWRTFLAKHGRPPVAAEVSHLKFAVGWKDKVARTTKKGGKTDAAAAIPVAARRNGNTGIDLGGIAKGHAVDLLVAALTAAGWSDVYVDWGADIRAAGSHPSGRPWRTAVMGPPQLGRLFALWARDRLAEALTADDAAYLLDVAAPPAALSVGVGVRGVAVATSGDYAQIQKFGYHHVINREAMAPMKAAATSVGSVSIVATSCAVADGLATAAMTYPSAAAAAAWLDGLIARRPELVLGYAILPRGAEAPAATALFTPVSDDLAVAGRGVGGAPPAVTDAELSPALASALDAASDTGSGGGADAAAIRSVTASPPRSLAVLIFDDGSGSGRAAVLLDTLASAALEPIPMVSMLLPAGHGGYAWAKTAVNEEASITLLTAADADLATRTASPGGLVDAADGADARLWARLARLSTLRVTVVSATQMPPSGLSPPAAAVLLTATVDTVTPSASDAPLLLRVGTVLTSLAPAASRAAKAGAAAAVAAAAASTLSTTAASLRSVLRSATSAVTLVTTTAIGGEPHALTATSVRVPAGASSLIVFNVSRDSLFGAALGDAGSLVGVCPLRTRHAPLAATFAASAAVTPAAAAAHFVLPAEQLAAAGAAAPAGDSVEAEVARSALPPLLRDAAAAVATVLMVMPAGDHVVVVAQAGRAVVPNGPPDREGHLVWLARQYQSVSVALVE